jgi:hypothetical protein
MQPNSGQYLTAKNALHATLHRLSAQGIDPAMIMAATAQTAADFAVRASTLPPIETRRRLCDLIMTVKV